MPWQSSGFTLKQWSYPLNIQQVNLVQQYKNSRKRHAQCSLHSTYHLKMLLKHIVRQKMLQMGKRQVEGHQSENLGHLTWKLINSMHLATMQKLSDSLVHLTAFPWKQWRQFLASNRSRLPELSHVHSWSWSCMPSWDMPIANTVAAFINSLWVTTTRNNLSYISR